MTLREFISSIKNKNSNKFAWRLQKKLEVAQNAIVKKTKKRQAVSNAEKEALKNSVASYTEKNRVLIPKTVRFLWLWIGSKGLKKIIKRVKGCRFGRHPFL